MLLQSQISTVFVILLFGKSNPLCEPEQSPLNFVPFQYFLKFAWSYYLSPCLFLYSRIIFSRSFSVIGQLSQRYTPQRFENPPSDKLIFFFAFSAIGRLKSRRVRESFKIVFVRAVPDIHFRLKTITAFLAGFQSPLCPFSMMRPAKCKPAMIA